jgi:hypothetical protein
VKLCSVTSTVAWPRAARASSAVAIRSWYGRKISCTRAATSAALKPTLPGMGVRSLIVTIDWAEPGWRLQSITSREPAAELGDTDIPRDVTRALGRG